MDLVATSASLRYGTGQVLTFAIPIATLTAVCFWGFFQRSNKSHAREDEKLFKLEDLQRRK
jgi:hypothetical protein